MRQFDAEKAVEISSATGQAIQIERTLSEDGKEALLYCHWVKIFFNDERSIGYEGKCLEERALRGMYGFLKIIRPSKEALS